MDDAGDPWTLEMIGEQLGVTRERIRQIQVQALQKLRRIVSQENIDFEEIL
ncbi:sigma factor-like helix-turn-helix DNA-binding protein [Mariprofundus ferrooxydans]|uniref:sigma factor-like helix-turn-helix DNA-binding protein n=1 Tax=Mariprofundus ferrooxydans TaxID=314344 RepID=UPI002285D17F|nr:sigma factor-like helix-turn-helix DNA-binding protein [Mariprofundus ferrooxydans]